jgi:uncharacterized damage-inducible protein DinB
VITDNYLVKLFEHNNWANDQIIRACYALTDEQLDSAPQSATEGSIRQTLTHFVTSQRGYLALLTKPVEARPNHPLAFNELQESARISGQGLLAMAAEPSDKIPKTLLQTRDGYLVEPWVVIVQIINHATEHREQIKSMLTALGVTPPEIDGWSIGEVTHALNAIAK